MEHYFGQWRFTEKFMEGLGDAMRERAKALGPLGIRFTRSSSGGKWGFLGGNKFTVELVDKDGEVIGTCGTTELSPGSSLTLTGVQESLFINFTMPS